MVPRALPPEDRLMFAWLRRRERPCRCEATITLLGASLGRDCSRTTKNLNRICDYCRRHCADLDAKVIRAFSNDMRRNQSGFRYDPSRWY